MRPVTAVQSGHLRSGVPGPRSARAGGLKRWYGALCCILTKNDMYYSLNSLKGSMGVLYGLFRRIPGVKTIAHMAYGDSCFACVILVAHGRHLASLLDEMFQGHANSLSPMHTKHKP